MAVARFLHTINAEKDGSIVASRVASALGGLANATSSSQRDSRNSAAMRAGNGEVLFSALVSGTEIPA